MSYGLDFSLVRYITDERGKPTEAILSIPVFSALRGWWETGHRAQTARIEAGTRPGVYRSALAQIVPDSTADAAPDPGSRYDRKWEALIARMPDESEPVIDAPPASPPAIIPPATQDTHPAAEPAAPVAKVEARDYFPHEFIEAPPSAVAALIGRGVPVLRAWRKYRGWTLRELAELNGTSVSNIKKHEQGTRKPLKETLAMFARLFDCTVEQLTPKPGNNTTPPVAMNGNAPHKVIAAMPARVMRREPRAPDDTDYPDAVMAHMLAGKSPLTAWRLYRRLSVAELAGQYGCGRENMRTLAGARVLHQGTITKLCAVLRCKPEQMLRPEGLDVELVARARPSRASQGFKPGNRDGREARTA
ncbi:helix-turn-helix domain-containing protein [Paraburkholderia adhaesiva]|uniref:helix-turn-helix domain-containing protein n=1 Tax=Paraburkholderia adhaesiva TaxID=2883244 RepID=UPI001F22C5B5|nr:helix-turn-helix transcriptional regulator [Paraburkholderia adhaesiva]